MRHKLRKFNQGLWVTPAEDEIPDGALRRGRGVNAIKTSSVRSRTGLTFQHNIDAHSIARFADALHYGVATFIGKGAVPIKAGLSGDALHFTPMPPTTNTADYLFVTGGGDTTETFGDLCKIDSTGDVTNWGIEEPNTESLVAEVTDAAEKIIDNMENLHPLDGSDDDDCDERWKTAHTLDGSGRGFADISAATTIFKEGTTALRVKAHHQYVPAPFESTRGWAAVAMDYYTLRGNNELDLTTFTGGGDSTEDDFISFWIRTKNAEAWDYFQLDFSCGASNFSGVVYSMRFVPIDSELGHRATGTAVGVGDLIESTTPGAERDWMLMVTKGRRTNSDPEITDEAFTEFSRKVASRLGKKKEQEDMAEEFSFLEIFKLDDAWQEVKVAKRLFTRTGDTAEPYDWSNVRAVRFVGYSWSSLEEEAFWLDDLRLGGGVGTQGTYQYNVTFRNSTTGHRSDAGNTIATVEDVRRQSISLSGIPVSTDAQVDQREIWRTVGGGVILWYCDKIDNNTTTTFVDTVCDPDQNYDATATVLSPEEMPIDNAPPYPSFTDCIYHNASAFWIDRVAGRKGHVYYSPIGRVESMEGLIRVTNDDDPLQRLFKWGLHAYVISESGIFQLLGTNPYSSKRVYGCVGTTAPDTLAVSNVGVFYEGDQGVRVFNGMKSVLVAPESIRGLFRGEASEELTSFTGSVAAAGREEYFISDGSQTLVYNYLDNTWRDFGLGFDAFCYAKDSSQLIGTYSGATYEIEDEGVYTDGGTAIPFSFQHKTLQLNASNDVLINHIHIDANPNGQTLTVTLLLDGASLALGTINDAARTTNTIAIGRYGQLAAIRITGNVSAQVEIFGVDFDTAEEPTNLLSPKGR